MDKIFLEECLDKGMSTRDIEKICNKKHTTISYWIKKYELQHKSNYYKTDNYKFEKIDTKEKAYVLGFLLADASINNTNTEISVSLYDKKVVEFISKIINGKVRYDHTVNKAQRRFPRARLVKKSLI